MSKENTKQIKGLAILLMLAHHLFAYPERMPVDSQLTTGIVLSGVELTVMIGRFSKICVSLFMFLGGYGLYHSAAEKDDTGNVHVRNTLLPRIGGLYLKYWKVFLLFVPAAFLFFGKHPQWLAANYQGRYDEFHFSELIRNFFGLSYSYNEEWWFFIVFIFSLFIGYIFLEAFRKNSSPYCELLSVIVWYLMCTYVFPALGNIRQLSGLGLNFWYRRVFCLDNFSSLFLAGIVAAKYDMISSLREKLVIKSKALFLTVFIAASFLIFYLRVFIARGNIADILLVPAMVVLWIAFADYFPGIRKPLSFLGRYSTDIWLSHSFFCYYFYPFVKAVCFTKNCVIAYITLLILSILAAIATEHIWRLILRPFKKRMAE